MTVLNSQSIDGKLREIMERFGIIGLSAAIVEKNEVVWSNHYGLANIEQNKEVNSHSVFRIASISKSILGTALMQLYEKGLFKLQDDISEYLGYTVRNPHFRQIPITFTQLLTHTSSLQDEYVDFVVASYCGNPPSSKEILLPGGKFYSDAVWGNYEPGNPDYFVYSNLASVVVATLIEALSGERYDQYCQKHIFKPLGMDETSNNIVDIDLSNVAVLYEYNRDEDKFEVGLDSAGKNRPKKIDLSNYVPGTNGGIFSPQGGCRSTALDLSKFLLAHMNGGEYNGARILQEETVNLMHQEHWTGNPPDTHYRKKGLQFQITDDLVQGKTLIGHHGDAYGLLSGLYFNKQDGKGIVFLTNGSKFNDGKLFFDVDEELAEALYNL
ncbi:MAG: serine hydrolase domain-containing protein [Bacilli bacterium]